MRSPVRPLFLSLLVIIATAVPGAAQDEALVDTASVTEDPMPTKLDKDLLRLREDLVNLDEQRVTLQELNAREITEPDERNLIRLEAIDRVEAMKSLLTSVSRRLPKLELEPTLADSFRASARRNLQLLLDVELGAFASLRTRIDTLRAHRSRTSAGDLGELESLVTREIELVVRVMEWARESALLGDELGVEVNWSWEKYDAELLVGAEDLRGRMQVARQERDRLSAQLKSAEGSGAEASVVSDLTLRVQAADQRIDGAVAGLNRLIRLLERRGLDASIYRRVLIDTTGEITEGILDPEVLKALLAGAWNSTLAWIRDSGPKRLVQLLILVIFIVLMRLLARSLWWIVRLSQRRTHSRLAVDMGQRMMPAVGTIAGLFFGLWVLGVNPAALLTGLGVASLIIGLALQDTLGNLAAGVFILIYRPYDVDDAIKAGGELGLVKAMGLANTTIVTFDNRRLYVPNRKIWSEVIENRSMETRRRVHATIRISYEDDLDQVMELVRGFLAEQDLVMDEPEPTIFVEELGSSWIEVNVWPWARIDNWWELYTTLPHELLKLLTAHGIRMPYSRREITLLDERSGNEESPAG